MATVAPLLDCPPVVVTSTHPPSPAGRVVVEVDGLRLALRLTPRRARQLAKRLEREAEKLERAPAQGWRGRRAEP